jgi:cytochrome c oxidase cbb3-type subunit I
MDARRDASPQIEPDFAARQSIIWAIAWLVGGVTITLLANVLLVFPDLNGLLTPLSYGRLRTIADTAIVFGWLGTVAFAAIYALIPRITEVQLHNEPLGAAATLFWSLILTGGIVALLLGVNQGRPLAELGAVADVAMLLMLVVVLFNTIMTVVRRREHTLYASGWFLLAAALLAPLVFIIGNLPSLTGTIEELASGYYLNGLEMLCMLPIGLGIAHYVIPVETGKPLYSAAMARTTFWSLMFAGGWTGHRYFLRGSAPDYLDSIAFAMTIVLLIPALSAAANLFATVQERWHLVSRALGLRFAAAGLGLLVVWMGLVTLTTTPSVYRFVGLTAWQAGVRHLAVFGVFSSFAFALIYHAYPLMVGRDWFSRPLASIHFWTTTGGAVAVAVLTLAIGAAESAAGAAGTPGVVPMLRIVTTGIFALVVVAQYLFAYNAVKTSRSGPFVHIATTAQALEASR